MDTKQRRGANIQRERLCWYFENTFIFLFIAPHLFFEHLLRCFQLDSVFMSQSTLGGDNVRTRVDSIRLELYECRHGGVCERDDSRHPGEEEHRWQPPLPCSLAMVCCTTRSNNCLILCFVSQKYFVLFCCIFNFQQCQRCQQEGLDLPTFYLEV